MLTHKQKLKLARRMRTKEEARNKVPVFQTAFWSSRGKHIIKEQFKPIFKKSENTHYRKEVFIKDNIFQKLFNYIKKIFKKI